MKDFEKFRLDNLAIQLFIYLKNYFDNTLQHFPFLSLTFLIWILLFVAALFLIRWIIRLKQSFNELSILLELTPPAFTEKSAYTTQQLLSVIHNLGDRRTIWEKLQGKKIVFSFEIVSTLNQGIRYLIRTTPEEVNNVKRSILSYLPQVSVKTVNEYLPANIEKLDKYHYKITEFKLKKHFAYPLQRQDALSEHDPIAYLTGMMTKLSTGELISFQIVLSPTKVSETDLLSRMILNNEDVLRYLDKSVFPSLLKPIFKILHLVFNLGSGILTELIHGSSKSTYSYQNAQLQQQNQINHLKPARVLSSFEQDAVLSIQEKINQSLFESSIRFLAIIKDNHDLKERTKGFISSISTFSVPKYQSLNPKLTFPAKVINRIKLLTFKKRLLSLISNKSSVILSTSEIGDLYHFPYSQVTQTENIVKVHSKQLPAPLSLKNASKLDITFAKNTYAGSETKIGLTLEERKRHMYILGATGTGKSTLLLSQISQDIENGKGICLIDPHGDLAKSVLTSIPKDREKDVIYIDPYDIKYPKAINLLEFTSVHLDQDDEELEKDFISESVISIFRKIFSSDFTSGSAHRIEYVLRNTIQTALTLKERNLFTIYDLLNDPDFRRNALRNVTDERLLKFWKNELGKAGNFQQVKMTAPITSRIGRFLFSPTAKRILDHQKSSINFDEILDTNKILICNLSKGNLGEDTSQVLGILILAKIQLASLKRARTELENRNNFYLYGAVDECN